MRQWRVEIRSSRLTLRTYRPEDAGPVLRYYADPDVCRYLCHDPWTVDDARNAVAKRVTRTSLHEGGGLNLVVEFGGQVIGNVAAWFVSDRVETVELGWTFARDVSGRGYATEAVQTLLELVFATDHVHRVIAQMDARNTASARLAQRVGMRCEAHFVQDCRCGQEWTDTLVYAALNKNGLLRPF